jgi:hypothetical protein
MPVLLLRLTALLSSIDVVAGDAARALQSIVAIRTLDREPREQ